MKRFIFVLIILCSVGLGIILGATYTHKKLADKFDLVIEMVKESDRLNESICRYILQEELQSKKINCDGPICA